MDQNRRSSSEDMEVLTVECFPAQDKSLAVEHNLQPRHEILCTGSEQVQVRRVKQVTDDGVIE